MEKETEIARQKVIDEIVQMAIEKIGRAGCRSVDTIAWFYFELMRDLGEEDRAEEVYRYYRIRWT